MADAKTSSSSSAGTLSGYKYIAEIWTIDIPNAEDDGCYFAFGRCCPVEPPAPGSESSSSGSTPSQGSGSGPGPEPPPLCGDCGTETPDGMCTYDWCGFPACSEILDESGGSGSTSSGEECIPPDPNTPSDEFLAWLCRVFSGPFSPDPTLGPAACFYAGGVAPPSDPYSHGLNSVRWFDTILPMWQGYVNTVIGLGLCEGVDPIDVREPPMLETWDVEMDYEVVSKRCVEITADDLCRLIMEQQCLLAG